METDLQFMVDFTLPETLNDEFMGLIPFQRAKVNKYFREGKLVNYALSLDNSKLWAVFKANSEMEVLELIAELPLTRFMQVEVSILTSYNAMSENTPAFSLN